MKNGMDMFINLQHNRPEKIRVDKAIRPKIFNRLQLIVKEEVKDEVKDEVKEEVKKR